MVSNSTPHDDANEFIDYLAWLRGRNERTRARYDNAIQKYKAAGDRLGEANVLLWLGDLESRLGRNEEAHVAFGKALLLFKAEGNRPGEANALGRLGNLQSKLDRNEEARVAYDNALHLYKAEGDSLDEANVLLWLGDLDFKLGRYEEARSAYDNAIHLYKAEGHLVGEANVLLGVGNLVAKLGHYEEARSAYDNALHLYEAAGERLGEANVLLGVGNLVAKLGRYEEARSAYDNALHLYEAAGDRLGKANVLLRLGELTAALGRNEEARAAYANALHLYEAAGDRLGEANVLRELDDLEAKPGGNKEIRSIDELLIYAGAVASKQVAYEPIELVGENFVLSARIDGNEWDQKIDVRLAKYVLLLQDSFDDLLEEYGDEDAFETPLKVRVEVREGSSIPWAEIAGQLQHLVTPMTPEMTFIAVMTAIGAIGGHYFVSRWRDSKDKKSELDAEAAALDKHEETKRQMIDVLRINAELNQAAFRGYERPPAHLTRCLEDGDTIEFAGEPPLDAEVAKKMAPKRLTRTSSETTYADGAYVLKRINYTEGEPVLDLAQGPHEIKGYISQLSEEDAKALFDSIHLRELSGKELPMTLTVQVNVSHTARNFKYGSIVGTGEPREDRQHKTLVEIAAGFR